MCLIIAPGRDGQPALLPRDVFNYSYSRNSDGFGAMWVEDGRVQHFKTLGLTADQMYTSMEEYVERHPDVIFHMRLKTHGAIIPGLSHPFRILNKNRHGKDLFFMHNGILSSFGNNLSYGQSDTTVFKDKILIPLLTRDPDALDDPEVWDSLNKLTQGSRLVFMDSDGKTYFTSDSQWNNRYGLKLSNTYMLPTENYAGRYSAGSSNEGMAYGKPGKATPSSHFVYYRHINRDGVLKHHWCSCPKEGYIRTEAGQLYRDGGANTTIFHLVDSIRKEDESSVLGLTVVPSSTPTKSAEESAKVFVDPVNGANDADDTLWSDLQDEEFSSDPVAEDPEGGPAPLDQRLRYARLVHNMYGGTCTSRVQLVADLIGMNDDEMGDFVLEDPGNAHSILSELVEMVLEYNQALWEINPNHEKILNADIVVEQGQVEYHQKAIKEITRLRQIEYSAALDEMNKEHNKEECLCFQCAMDREDEEKVNVA